MWDRKGRSDGRAKQTAKQDTNPDAADRPVAPGGQAGGLNPRRPKEFGRAPTMEGGADAAADGFVDERHLVASIVQKGASEMTFTGHPK